MAGRLPVFNGIVCWLWVPCYSCASTAEPRESVDVVALDARGAANSGLTRDLDAAREAYKTGDIAASRVAHDTEGGQPTAAEKHGG
jgi:hypothetical protein